jgi:hypothetical protein
MSTPPEKRQPLPDEQVPGSGFLSAVLTIIALAPLGAVIGMVFSYRVGGDPAIYALCGAGVGLLLALVVRNR